MATETRPIPLPHVVSDPSLSARVWVRVEWLLLVVCAGIFTFQTLPSAFATLQTDFPNYFLTAKLAREGIDTAHMYEWRWLARQKDHHEIDRSIIGLVPITPFSTLAVMPLSGFKPLMAKRLWLVLQIGLLVAIIYGLGDITGQPLRRVMLIVLGCPPLHRNLLYGQFYVLLAALLIGACWAHQCKHKSLAGVLVALATAIKLFPLIFCLYFLRKREWRALLATALTSLVCMAISVSVFGWEVHRTYLRQVLPWTLRGEGLPPFALGSGSLSTLLHCLFLYEPQWNPHPWHSSPLLFVVLQAVLSMLILAPALLLCDERDHSKARIALEWSVLTVAALTISTIPASYNFTLLVLPITVLTAWLLAKHSSLVWLAVALYIGIGSPSGWNMGSASGLSAVFQVSRLYMLITLVVLFYWAMGAIAFRSPERRVMTFISCGMLALVTVFQVVSGARHLRGLYDDFAYRVQDSSGTLLAAAPAQHNGDVLRIAMQPTGYRLLEHMNDSPSTAAFSESSTGPDEISLAASDQGVLMEIAGAHSTIISHAGKPFDEIADAESPVISSDGRYLAYLRVHRGRGTVFVRPLDRSDGLERPLTPDWVDVEQATFLPDASLVVAGLVKGTAGSHLFHVRAGHEPELLPLGEARYPAASPNGNWLVFSRMHRGNWNLALLDLNSGSVSNISDAECNLIEPSWESDSMTILYSSDCGRALWFTAVSRRRIIR